MTSYAPAWEKRYSRKLVWTDFTVVIVSVTAGCLVARHFFNTVPGVSVFSAADYTLGTLVIAVIYTLTWLNALSVYDARHPSVFGTGPEEYNRVLSATFMSFGLISLVLYLFGAPAQRSFLLVTIGLGTLLLLIGRWIWRKRLHYQRRNKRNTYRTLLVGERKKSSHTARQLKANALAGFELIGAVTPDGNTKDLVPGVEIVADLDDILRAVIDNDIDTLIVTSADSLTPRRLRELGWELESLKVDLIVATALTDIAGPRIHTRPVSGLPLIHVENPQFRGWRYFAKRMFDLFGSLLGIVILSPLLIVLAVAIASRNDGPIVFTQTRLGLHGTPFTMYKFRTMRVNAEAEVSGFLDQNDGNGVLFKLKDDPRVTPIGKFMRRHSLDELLQLFNVFMGDMSLVGPRPPLPQETESYEKWVKRRMFVRPGISGLWQVSGRSDLSWDESVRLDLYYVENWSLMGDLLILWRTVRTVLKGEGAY